MVSIGFRLGGKYRLDQLLGQGGMGSVFAAENENTGRRVAVKVLHGEWMQRPEVAQRFIREARATTAIAHPNIVEVLDLDTDPTLGIVYIVQELLQGQTLEAYLQAQPARRLAPADALDVLVPIMGAIVAAHARGIVHRDLKPANIFLTRARNGSRLPKVIDFGIAKDIDQAAGVSNATREGTAIGTPEYMSPEQVAGLADLDARTDVWSLGVILYELLSGHAPYEAPHHNLVMGKILYESPIPLAHRCPELSPQLVAVVEGALQRDRQARFPSVSAMLSVLLECPDAPRAVDPAQSGAWSPALVASPDPPASPMTMPMTGGASSPFSLAPGMATGSLVPKVPDTMNAVERTGHSATGVHPARSRFVFAGLVAGLLVVGSVAALALKSDPRPSVPAPVAAPVLIAPTTAIPERAIRSAAPASIAPSAAPASIAPPAAPAAIAPPAAPAAIAPPAAPPVDSPPRVSGRSRPASTPRATQRTSPRGTRSRGTSGTLLNADEI